MNKVKYGGIYEIHNLEDKNLPIIFHHDTISRKKQEFVNWHENIEILYCTAGAGQILYSGVVHELTAGDMVIINSNVLHGSRAEDTLEYHCLIVDSDFLAANDIKVTDIEFESIIRSDQAARIYDELVEEILDQKEYRVTAIRVLVLNLMLHLVREYTTGRVIDRTSRVESEENIKIAIGYMKSNFARKLTLDDIAAEVGLSKYYLAHEFKKATGMTVVNFLNVIRCRNAKKLLLKRKYSVREAAVQCGFENDSYFSKTFKNVMGCLPSEVLKEEGV